MTQAGYTKLKKYAQRAGIQRGAKHVAPYTRRKANKVLRRISKDEIRQETKDEQ